MSLIKPKFAQAANAETISRETTVSISCRRAWGNELTGVGRSQNCFPKMTSVYSTVTDIAVPSREDTCMLHDDRRLAREYPTVSFCRFPTSF